MATDDEPLGISIDIGKILKDVTAPPKRRSRSRSASNRGSGDLDAALRRAIRVELADVERALRDLAEEVVRLRRANEALADRVARLARD